ncbi:monovalent cation/H(+) antiporter subunit G [Motiliproteus sp. SC1-56]|uniref:cation:proton antiporter n=1 Tax=Motiliproteus sp. SC1-56 TaxID=2799565 RepID=UPI001A8F709A|nr:monovalent cation/H(+) antiporter subunit G [Motiliproteus sp. SC1-56]
MFSPGELITALLLLSAIVVFAAGTLALLRLPDPLCRLHALTKIDNLGFGLLAAGLALIQPTWIDGLKLLAIWTLILCSSTTNGYLIAHHCVWESRR